jgi:hypothetical protein
MRPNPSTIRHNSPTVVLVPTPVGCCPSAARRPEHKILIPPVEDLGQRTQRPTPWTSRRPRPLGRTQYEAAWPSWAASSTWERVQAPVRELRLG